ncbi:MAG: rhodanese-like domain-containing protein [Marivirga sp.]|nr:rhodanese-like domain-containing protein [Marivirga sp.]
MKTIQSFEDLNNVEFQRRLKENIQSVLLDVRTQEEFKGGRIPGSVNMDVMDITFYERITSLDKSKTYFVYCRSGGRSRQACSIMNKLGFIVINLAGGIMSWSGEVI